MKSVYKKEELIKIIEKVIDRMMSLDDQKKDKEQNGTHNMKDWGWPQGICLYAMLRYYEFTKEQKILEYVISWFDAHIKAGLPVAGALKTTPMLAMAMLYDFTKDEKYICHIQKWAEDILNELPRTEQNGLQNYDGSVNDKYHFECTRSQLWVESVFSVIPFLAKVGNLLGEKKYTDEATRQLLLHFKYLYDKGTGLLYHVWSFDGRTNFSKAMWARGNCWFAVGVVDFFEFSKLSGGARLYITDSYVDYMNALKNFQHEDGAWSTLVDQMETYKETSGIAGFTYGILKAVREGIISKEYKKMGERSLDYLLENISLDGTVNYVSKGTGLSRWDLTPYKTIGTAPMIYGQGLAIMALTEALYLAK